MATAFEDKGNQHLICPCYIRLNCDELNVSLIFPTAIILIIIHYFINPFEWDSEKCDEHITISNDKLTMINKKSMNGAILSKNLLSSDTLKHANWEMTLKSSTSNRNVMLCYVRVSQLK